MFLASGDIKVILANKFRFVVQVNGKTQKINPPPKIDWIIGLILQSCLNVASLTHCFSVSLAYLYAPFLKPNMFCSG